MQTYFKTDYAHIEYDTESNAVVFSWLIPGSYDEFRESMEKIMEAEQYFKTGKLIVDTNHQGIIHPDNQKWLATDWMERASKMGHTHTAIIMPRDILAAMSVEETISQVNGVIAGCFNNLEDAIEWIRKA